MHHCKKPKCSCLMFMAYQPIQHQTLRWQIRIIRQDTEESTRDFIRSAILTKLVALKQTMETYRQPISWSKTLRLWPSKHKACSILLTTGQLTAPTRRFTIKVLTNYYFHLVPPCFLEKLEINFKVHCPMQSRVYAGLLKYCATVQKLQSVQDLSGI